MLGFLKRNFKQREIDIEFRRKVVHENSRWAVILLILISISQLVLIIIEAFNVLPWNRETFIFRISVLLVSAIIATLLISARRNPRMHKYLLYMMVMLNVIGLIAGTFFILYFTTVGNFSLTVFLLVVYVLSLSYVLRPCFFTLVYFIVYTIIIIHLSNTFDLTDIYIGEIISAGIFLLLMGVGSSLSYLRYKRLFAQEKKVEEINKQLEITTMTDELTGLNNRRRTMDEINTRINLFKRYGTGFTLSMVDIDNFKEVNDKHGHSAGDDVLREFSGFLQSRLRTSDFIGRWGGEEFILILPNTEEEDAYKLMTRLQDEISTHEFNGLRIAFSAGLCACREGMSLNELISCADDALYTAKDSGRNRTDIYNN